MRAAVVGAGEIGQMRARALLSVSGASLAGVADTNQAAAERATHSTGARVVDDYRRFLDAADIDTMIISTPVGLHEEMVMAALSAGKHVLVEKPLSNSLESCRRIYEAANASGRTVAVGFNHRYFPAMKYLKTVVDEGRIGTLDTLRVYGGHDGIANFRADWMYVGSLSGGGAMMDVGIHMTDLARFVMGEVSDVYGVAASNVWKVPGSEDRALAIFRARSGATASYEATWNEWRGYRIHIEAYGDKGMVRAAYGPMFNLLITQPQPGARRTRETRRYLDIAVREKVRGWQSTAVDTFRQEIEDFMRRREGVSVPLATALDGLRAVEIAQAVYTSTRTGAVVPIG